jgi:hypothetical protein
MPLTPRSFLLTKGDPDTDVSLGVADPVRPVA